MIPQAWDADGHIYEWEGTFADPYWDPKLRDQRPRVVEVDETGRLAWLIDHRMFPVNTGPYQKRGGTPASKGGVPSPSQRTKLHDPVESAELRTAADRLRQMDDENIWMQINYPTMLLSWPLGYAPGLGTAIARSYNSWIADVSSQAPDRLKWVTVIDPGDNVEAAKEIYRTKDLGSAGVMVWGLADNKHLDDPWYEPVWKACEETGLPMAVHPGFSCPALDALYNTASDSAAIPFVLPVVMAFHRIIAKGLLDRYPTVKVGFMETGCQWLPFIEERIEENSDAAVRTTTDRTARALVGYKAELMPEDYIKRGQVYIGFEVNEKLLPFLVDEYGSDCWLYASDIPHGHRMHKAGDYFWEQRQDLSPETKTRMLVDNTAGFYGLKVGAPTGSR